MRRTSLLIALAASAIAVGHAATQSAPEPAAERAGITAFAELPPPPAFPDDPADSLYRAAREALSRNEYGRAAGLFRQITDRHPRSAYAPDALYWEAFALYRLGGGENLRAALQRLEVQRRAHPRARTRGDADALATRVRGTLAQRGDSDAAQAVARQAARAARSCPSEDEDTRTAALNALLHVNAEQAVPVLRQVLARRDECSAPLRERAVFLLAEHETPQTADLLLDVARTDPSPAVREQAVFWLSEVGSERALEVLTDILQSDGDIALREKAIFALSQHPSARANELLRRAAAEPALPAALREEAIFWLHDNGTPENAAFLRELYGRLQAEGLKEKALFSVAEMGGRENQAWLLAVATNPREPMEMRKHALFWASEGGVPVAQLARLYDRVSEPELREQVIFVLSQRDEPEAVDQLIQIARAERDPELRKKAIFWLSESDDPRAAQVLLEIIRQPE